MKNLMVTIGGVAVESTLVVVKAFSRSMFVPMLLAMGIAAFLGEMALAQSVDLIPEAPVPLEDYVAEGSEKMGVIVGTVVGVWFVYMLIKKGLRWARGAF